MAQVDRLLQMMKPAGASDLHLKAGMKPRYRVQGELKDVEACDALSRDEVDQWTRELLSEEQDRWYRESGEIDFAYGDVKSGRFRCNFFQEFWGPAAVFRRIPVEIPSLKDLNLPASIESLIHLRGGIVLVTGPTGSGKTSTLASLVDLINQQQRRHIITLEDPIEYLQPSKRSVVHQRGLHYDITDFPTGLRAALREDPDILLIGEMRDLDTIRLALTAAEVGSLVFATLHTNGAAQSVDRIIDVFPADEQPQIRAMLSQSLQGVVSQVLLKQVATGGRIPATEVMFGNPAVSNLIRENKIQDIVSVIQAGKQQGMHTLDDSLVQLVTKKVVDPEEAYSYAENKGWFEQFVDLPLTTQLGQR
ncbi:MAG TPA: type IV pilus twitching motility protein PilT [Planctomycetota bacterium]|nr:type IV pilus twitching motility protein PilT [Planctomycetota bacterium]